MEERRQQILEEISQLLAQYRQEVPGRHRAWPESMKSRVAELHADGMKFAAIARATGIPYYTVLQWRGKSGAFRAVRVVASKKAATVAVATASEKVSSVTDPDCRMLMLFPNGIRVEGVSAEFLKQLLPVLLAGKP